MVEFDQKFLDRWNILDWGYTEELEARSFGYFSNWVQNAQHGSLKYLADERKDKRENLKSVYPECQSALVFLFDYNALRKTLNEKRGQDKSKDKSNGKIASYVYAFGGLDYHHAIAQALTECGKKLQESFPELLFKSTVDTAPILERDLAFRAGLGWFGKNSMLISRKGGSFNLIGTLLLNKKMNFKPNVIDSDHCGTCTACVTACPTNAIDPETRTLTAESCLSTFTIEHFKPLSAPAEKFSYQEVFGCDICQDVCPWNQKTGVEQNNPNLILSSPQAQEIYNYFELRPIEESIQQLEAEGNRQYQRQWKKTALERTGRIGMLKNLKNILRFKKI